MRKFYFNILRREKNIETENDLIVKNINAALYDICQARTNFDMATGDDDIELAIYELSTAEIKYRNLIREARRLGIVSRGIAKLKRGDDNGEVEGNRCS